MVTVYYRDMEYQVPGNVIIRELIKSLGLNPESVLAVIDGKLVNNEKKLGEQGEIRLIPVISGG